MSNDFPWLDTHPFLTFRFDPNTVPAATWMKLGEAMSKCQHLAGVPLKPAFAMELMGIYLVRGVQATTAIEGNTLSTEEVAEVVMKGTANLPPSREYLEQEVRNIALLITDIDYALKSGIRFPISQERLREIDRRVLENIPDEPHVVPGEYRTYDVMAGPYKAPHHTDVPELMSRFVKWLAELRGPMTRHTPPVERFTSAVLGAVLAHLYFAWIHPFGNGNGRTARLLEVQILSESGVVPLVSTNLLSDHYNKTRNAYYLALSAAQRNPVAFINYAIQGFVDELRSQIARVREENILVHWQSLVYELFNSMPPTKARARQREVALRMPVGVALTPEQVTDLTPSLARKYAACGDRTPARDLNDLVKIGLVERVARRQYRVKREIIEAFIPPVAD